MGCSPSSVAEHKSQRIRDEVSEPEIQLTRRPSLINIKTPTIAITPLDDPGSRISSSGKTSTIHEARTSLCINLVSTPASTSQEEENETPFSVNRLISCPDLTPSIKRTGLTPVFANVTEATIETETFRFNWAEHAPITPRIAERDSLTNTGDDET